MLRLGSILNWHRSARFGRAEVVLHSSVLRFTWELLSTKSGDEVGSAQHLI